MCYRCFWPKQLCWCPSLVPMPTRTRFIFLMHPKEFKEEKAGTGRLTQLCLPNSELHMGKGFDEHEAVQAVLNDPRNFCVLLYPGIQAINLSENSQLLGPATAGTNTGLAAVSNGAALSSQLHQRQLVVLLLDATWSGARKMLRLSPSLQRLPRIMFTPSAPSRYIIKQQPQEGCLSTLEAVHELLLALERAGLDHYPQPDLLLGLFRRMQDFQIQCAADPARPGYRRKPYGDPATRRMAAGDRAARRDNFLKKPATLPETEPGSRS
jgi:DTW domain-containing protein YfiP